MKVNTDANRTAIGSEILNSQGRLRREYCAAVPSDAAESSTLRKFSTISTTKKIVRNARLVIRSDTRNFLIMYRSIFLIMGKLLNV